MSFERAQKFVAKWEGGYCNDANDPGGATNWGICLKLLKELGEDVNDDGEINVLDVKALTKEQAAFIMKREFWSKEISALDYDRPAIAMVMYDTAVNMGPKWAVKFLQKAVGADDDGIFGPKTWAALKDKNDFMTAKMMIALRRARYEKLVENNPKLKVFFKGWLNRITDLEREIGR